MTSKMVPESKVTPRFLTSSVEKIKYLNATKKLSELSNTGIKAPRIVCQIYLYSGVISIQMVGDIEIGIM